MVVRKGHTNPQPRTPAQMRRAAQRKIAREVKSGKYTPSPIGRKSREVTKNRREIVNRIAQKKERLLGSSPKFNAKRSRQYITTDPDTHKPRTIEELEEIEDGIDQALDAIAEESDRDPFWWAWDNIFEDAEYENAIYYH